MFSELRKVFLNKIVLCLFVATIGALAVFPYVKNADYFKQISTTANTYKKIINNFSSTDDYAKQVKAIDAEISYIVMSLNLEDGSYVPQYSKTAVEDAVALTEFKSYLEYIGLGFTFDRCELVRQNLIRAYDGTNKDRYQVNSYKKVVDKYNRVVDVKLINTGVRFKSLYDVFNNSLMEVVLIIFSVLLTVIVFYSEYASKAHIFINTSKYNMKSLYFKKLGAIWITVAVIITIQAATELFCGIKYFGMENLNSPVQQIEYFKMCPYSVSIIQFFAIKYLLKLLVFTAIISVIAFLISVTKNSIVAMSCGVILFAGTYIFNRNLFLQIGMGKASESMVGMHNIINTFLPVGPLNLAEYYESFYRFRLFAYPMDRLVFDCSVTGVIIVLSSIFGYKFIVRKGGKRNEA